MHTKWRKIHIQESHKKKRKNLKVNKWRTVEFHFISLDCLFAQRLREEKKRFFKLGHDMTHVVGIGNKFLGCRHGGEKEENEHENYVLWYT